MLNHHAAQVMSLAAALLIVAFPHSAARLWAAQNAASSDQAHAILEDTGIEGGLIVQIGCGDGSLSLALRANDRYLVHALDGRSEAVARARETILKAGVYGHVSVAHFDGRRLPYADNIVNLVVSENLGELKMSEVMRVLVPNGIAYICHDGEWTKTVKPWPTNMGQWSHHLHAADGNPVTPDELVGPPQRIKWLAGPKWQRAHDTDANVNALVTAGGRLFYMVDEAPIGLPGPNGLPDKWMLAARDAFNGLLLWKLPVDKWGWREYKDTHYRTRHDVIPVNVHRRVVATKDHVYVTLGIGAPVSRLEAATGAVQHVYDGSEGAREILFDRGRLLLTVPGANGLQLIALEADSGKKIWESGGDFAGSDRETGKLKVSRQAVLNMAASGDAVCLVDGPEIVCLNWRDGTETWRSKPSSKGTSLWIGTLIVNDGVVLYAEQGRMTALDATDGSTLWTREAKQPGGLWFSWKDVYVVNGLVWTWGPVARRSPSETHALDLKTGEVTKRVALGNIFNVDHHHRCYRNKATPKYIIASRRGAEFIDLEGGSHSVNNWVRGICHLGMMPANGLLYAPPEPCKCYWYERVSDFCALAPAPVPGEQHSRSNLSPRLVRGPATEPPITEKFTFSEDWLTLRADPTRSGSTNSQLPDNLEPIWQARLPGKPTAPIVAGGRVYVAAVDAHTVYAFDQQSGGELWHHTAGGRIDSPPTYVAGKVVFGSSDGAVTCLRASDGELAWRFRAAPRDRLIGAYSQLESPWPVHSSVLAQDNKVYFAAGRSSYLDGGILLYGLDVDSGKQLCHTVVKGPEVDLDNEAWFDGYNEAGGRGALSDVLQLSGPFICMRNQVFDQQLNPQTDPAPPHLQPLGGFLDDSYFKRYFWFYGSPMDRSLYAAMAKPTITQEQMAVALAQLLVQDDEAIYGLRMFDSMKLLNPNNYFVPGKEGYLLFKVAPGEGNPAWTKRVPIRVTAMAAARDRLVIAGPPDVLDPKDPLAAFEARKGGRLRIISKADGSTQAEFPLDAPPVFHGVAVAWSQVFVTLADGKVVCLAEPQQ